MYHHLHPRKFKYVRCFSGWHASEDSVFTCPILFFNAAVYIFSLGDPNTYYKTETSGTATIYYYYYNSECCYFNVFKLTCINYHIYKTSNKQVPES